MAEDPIRKAAHGVRDYLKELGYDVPNKDVLCIDAAMSVELKPLLAEIERYRAWVPVAVEAMRAPIDEVRGKGRWTANDPDESSWSPAAHIELTLSVDELRKLAAAIASAPKAE